MKPLLRRLALVLVVLSLLTVGVGWLIESLQAESGTLETNPPAQALEWKAGVATAKITPFRPMPMAGYAGRKDNPSEGTEQDLFAKALAVEDSDGNRAVIVTTDLIGIIASLREDVEKKVEEKYGLPPESLLMNASHTHCGPSYGRDDTKDYFDFLSGEVVRIIGEAIESMEPARLGYCAAKCGFAMNRRTPTPDGYRNHPNPEGVVDHTVPVLRIDNPEGELKAVVFGYSCHNTTMGFMKWLGDYAGYAQEYFEADHPGVTAMFMNNCSGDQNPYPRSLLYYAQRHGRSLATAVEAALETNQRQFFHQHALSGPLKTVMERLDLEFTEESKRDPFSYPVQVLQFGDGLSLITLGSEVTVDYSLRLKKELADRGPAIWVAGYSNVYSGYVPSKRVLLEGGYEAQSRPWKPELEERIIAKVHELFDRVN
ncbi:MAG: neutral/alkaline non-lysosomal ceramidase N-terminal domain-containing protein [Verrucomicrobiae bacterium]|nr:neutral/alkaline non-lysosomal ceramidase N-terminal domain-containing protein [Verrucomicrobiae bacterium]